MKHEARIRAAIEKGEIRKIVVIDDAFDAPVLGDEDAGPMLDFLENAESAPHLQKARVSPDETAAAIAAINASEYADEGLQAVVRKIYDKFVEKFEDRYDPSGRFQMLKGDNLRRVRPLLRLLSRCAKVKITRIGSDDTGVDFAKLKPDAVFVDYYLDATLAPEERPPDERGGAARRASLAMLRQVLSAKPGVGPSVMLMSSHSVRDEADSFRREIQQERKVFASRFQYLAKDDLDEEEDGSITVAGPAADALLDIAQRHRFAGAIEDALTHWKDGADRAIASIWDTITELELKDYAYLARFRLAEEGQPLSSYLEWFFGEVLVDAIARSVKWDEKSFGVLDESASTNKPGSQIEGAFDGPTNRVAELYYRARVDERPARQGKDLRMGDVYVRDGVDDEMLAVITPDCDLIERRGKRAAKRMTVVAGNVKAMDVPDSSIADFFMRGGEPVNVVWVPEDIRTIEYEAARAGGIHRLLGTLRPLYAYELQRRVLSDMGRVGLAVAPAMGMTAKAEVVVRLNATAVRLDLSGPERASCAVIPRRGGTDKPRIVYHRSFAAEVLDRLLELSADELDEDGRAAIRNLGVPANQIKFVDKLCRDGQRDGDEAFGIISSLQPERTKAPIPWCQILVSHKVGEDPSDPGADEEGALEQTAA